MFNCLLFGTKGCGKTQLLHMLAGTEPSPQAAPYTPNSGLRAARFIPGYDGAPDTVWLALLGIVHAYTHTHTHTHFVYEYAIFSCDAYKPET